eukprot:jgi/Chlat1/1914/Chrsp149S02220
MGLVGRLCQLANAAVLILVLWAALKLGQIKYANQRLVRTNFAGQKLLPDGHTEIVTRARDTDGQYYEVRLTTKPNAPGFFADKPGSTPYHLHLNQTETFTVETGTMDYILNGTLGRAHVGDTVAIPPNWPHLYYNGGKDDLVVLVKLEPALVGEAFFENIAGTNIDAPKSSSRGIVEAAQMLEWAGIRVGDVHPTVAFLIGKVLGPVGELVGYKCPHPEYTADMETASRQYV